MNRNSILCLAGLCLWLTTAGCASSGMFKFGKAPFPKTSARNPATQIVGLWQAGEGIGLDGKTTRGFAGQVMFFAKEANAAAEVDGEVRIFVFDDQGPAEEQVKPIHQFEFSRGAWKAHLCKSALGATYDVFIPYTRQGTHEARCSLRVRYTPHGGGAAIYSETIEIVLPGQKAPDVERPRADDVPAVPPSPTDAAGLIPTPQARTMAQSIPLPDEREKLRSARPAAVELTPQERERVLREARAKFEAETKGGVTLASYEEPASGNDAHPQETDDAVPAGKKRHPLDE